MSQESQTVRVTLIGKPDCHLCADARGVIATVCAELGVGWQEVSILDDPELADEYWDKIPVTLIDGDVHDIYRVDPARLRSKLT
ncbi:MAG TPA: NrdH-redoxin [Actinobacteria bacterium]|jgi:glutaredoxin|nr:NrdH-redoxin [Actinomycetota bacterium]